MKQTRWIGWPQVSCACVLSKSVAMVLGYNTGELIYMPTVLRIGQMRFFFFSREDNEPAHIHVESAENAAKFWLSPVRLEWAVGYNSKELGQVRRLVEEHVDFFLEKWNEHLKCI